MPERPIDLRREIQVTTRNIWFLERSIPRFGLFDFFPTDSIGADTSGKIEATGKSIHKLTIQTDQGWSFTSDITSDSKILRNCSRNRGTGKWVVQADLHPGDRILIERLGEYEYRLSKANATVNQTAS